MNRIKLFSIFLLSALILYSCNKSDNGKTAGDVKTDTAVTKTQKAPDSVVNSADDKIASDEKPKTEGTAEINKEVKTYGDAVKVEFPPGLNYTTTGGRLTGFGDQKKFMFYAKKGQKLTATVMPRKGDGNVRISQIIDPTRNADGPFGPEAKYNITQTGEWMIVISENQMAGEPWEGDFVLMLKVE